MLDNNLKGIEPDFSKNSNFNPKSNVSQVKFGADAPVLEVELNELQQVQDKAREDLIRSMIPSGFTTPVEIDFPNSNSDSLVTLNDAEAYVNGMRIFIPKGTKIDLGDSPTEKSRDDLIFLEVWKEEVNSQSILKEYGGENLASIPNNLEDPRVGEETSHRVINRWRIRCAHDINFKANPDGLRQAGTSFNDANVFAQGGREKPITKEDSIELFTCIFSQTNTDSIDNPTRNWSYKDTGLYLAGKGIESKDILKTLDGYSLAIPMFKLYRRPNQGYCTGDYNSLARNVDAEKLHNLLSNEKVGGVNAGDLGFKLKGSTIVNLADLATIPSKDFNLTSLGVITAITKQSSTGIPLISLNVGRPYTALFKLNLKDIKRSENSNSILYTEVAQIYSDSTPSEYPRFDIQGEGDITVITKVPFVFKENTSKIIPQISARGVSGRIEKAELLIVEGDFDPNNFPSNITTGFNHVGILEDGKYVTQITASSSDIEESKMEITTKNPIMGISDSIRDIVYKDGIINSRIAKGQLNGSEPWSGYVVESTDGNFVSFQVEFKDMARNKILSNLSYTDYPSDDHCRKLNGAYLGIYKGAYKYTEWLYLTLPKNILDTPDTKGLKKYLASNPIDFLYEKARESYYPSLPNGIKNLDDEKGSITKYVDIIKNPQELNWGLDSAVTQEQNRLRFFVRVSDKYSAGNGTHGNDVFCSRIATKYMNNLSDPTPRLWSYWENSIYIDVSCNDIGCTLSEPNNTKVDKFKKWLENLHTSIFYRKASPEVINYPLEYAEISGDIILTSKEANISFNSNVKPVLELTRPATTNIDLFKDCTYINVDGGIAPSKITIGDTVVNNSFGTKLTPTQDEQDVPVLIEGRTLVNIHKKQSYAFGNNLESSNYTKEEGENYVKVNITKYEEGKYYFLYAGSINFTMLEPNTTYTLIAEEATDGLSPTIKCSDYSNELTKTSTPFKNNIATITTNDLSKGYKEQIIYIEFSATKPANVVLKNLMVIKGTITEPMSYFEGLKSLGETTGNKISILSRNKNLFVVEQSEKGKYIDYTNGNIIENSSLFLSDFIDIGSFENIIFNKVTQCAFYDLNKTFIEGLGISQSISLKNKNYKYIRFWNNITDINTFQLEVGNVSTEYITGKEDKKDILLKESLRAEECISTNNGVTKVYRNKAQYTFTGNEDIVRRIMASETKTIGFGVKISELNNCKLGGLCISDRFIYSEPDYCWNIDKECISIPDYVHFRIDKSKLVTPDIAGFKAWLRDNPTTIIYELAEPYTKLLVSEYSSKNSSKCSFIGQLGNKKSWDSGLDFNTRLVVTDSNVENTSWANGEIRECSHAPWVVDVNKLVNVPLMTDGGYSDFTKYHYEIIKLLPNNKILIKNTGEPNSTAKRNYYVHPVASTRPSDESTISLQKKVSLTGNDYTSILERAVKDHLY